MAFQVTTALKKMLAMEARKKVVQGATSSGKTYGIIPIIYDKLVATDGLKATVVAETLPAVKEGALDIFKNFMYDEGRWNDNCWNASTLTYTRPNRSRIQFKSFDSEGKAKASGKRDILFLNEANHIPFSIADTLIIRSKEVWLDFNADAEFWAHTEVLPEHNSEFLKLTYEDNEAIPEETLEDLMIKKAKADEEERAGNKGYWYNWWRVYGLGEIGSLQGVVFNNWQSIKEVPKEATLKAYGLDFGFTNDPSALTAIYQYNGKYLLDEVVYSTNLTNQQLSEIMLSYGVSKNKTIYADSAEPKSIQELTNYGWRVKPAEKGKDSVMFGINKMQESDFLVTETSINLVKELRHYTWDTDRTGKTLNKPVDKHNHAIDGVRYYFTTKDKFSGNYNYG